ncbi:hypothetical protein ABK040_008418 [Willaertia magna]
MDENHVQNNDGNNRTLHDVKPSEMFEHALSCFESYFSNNGGYPPNDFVNIYASERKLKQEESINFITDIIQGVGRYRDFIDIILKVFSQTNFKKEKSFTASMKEDGFTILLSKEEQDIFSLVAYLIFFKLGNGITVKQLGKLISRSLTPTKLARFLAFVCDESNIKNFFVEHWLKLFEETWIGNTIKQVSCNRSEIKALIDKFEGKVYVEPKESTKPKPFTLTQPKEKPLPEVEVIEHTFKSKPIPETTYKPENETVTKALEEYKESKKKIPILDEKVKEKNKNLALKKLEEAAKLKIPSMTKREKKFEVEEKASPKIKIKDIEEVRKILDRPASVKFTAAAILREDAIYKKKQEKEVEILKKYESELRDASEFVNWQENMKERDFKLRQEEIEKKKREAMISDINAKIVRDKHVEKNTKLAVEHRQKSREEIKVVKEKKLKEVKQLEYKNKQQSKEIQKKLQTVKTELTDQKKKTATEIKQQREINEKLVQQQLLEEQRKKEDLIRQIKAIVNVPKKHISIFDPTSTSDVGLLTEMSYVELQARLDFLKQEQEREKEEKKVEIIEKKKDKEKQIMDKLQNLRKFRSLAKKERETKKASKQQQEEEKAKQTEILRKESILSLNEKLEKKKELKLKDQQKRMELENNRKQNNAKLEREKEDIEKKHWENQEKGAERSVLERIELSKRASPVRVRANRKEKPIPSTLNTNKAVDIVNDAKD